MNGHLMHDSFLVLFMKIERARHSWQIHQAGIPYIYILSELINYFTFVH